MKTYFIISLQLITVVSFAQNNDIAKYYTKTNKSGSFVTVFNNEPVKDNEMYQEITTPTDDGGTTTLVIPVSSARLANVSDVESGAKVYPNPVSNYFTIETNLSSNTSGKITFLLYNAEGFLVKRIDNINFLDEITVSKGNLSIGLYLYSFTSDSKLISSGKLSIE